MSWRKLRVAWTGLADTAVSVLCQYRQELRKPFDLGILPQREKEWKDGLPLACNLSLSWIGNNENNNIREC